MWTHFVWCVVDKAFRREKDLGPRKVLNGPKFFPLSSRPGIPLAQPVQGVRPKKECGDHCQQGSVKIGRRVTGMHPLPGS